jgi:hypothetical protein
MNKISLIFLIILFTGCKESMEDKIKSGYFNDCQIADVETLINSFFSNPKWESFISPDDNLFHLNIEGQITFNGKPAEALVQFQMDKNDSWFINAFEINSQSQADIMISSLISKMCEEYNNSNGSVENSNSYSQNNSFNGTYISEDNSYYIKIIIDGNTWRGESRLVTGFGYENDSQTSEYWEGTLIDNQVYIGDTNVGKVTKNFLDIQLGSEYFSLQKN